MKTDEHKAEDEGGAGEEGGAMVDRRGLLRGVKSVVVKIGTNALSDAGGRLDVGLMAGFAGQVAELMRRGVKVTMVSSGAIGAGMAELGMARRPRDLSALQAAASVGQPVLMNLFAGAFRKHGVAVGQILVTRSEFENRVRYLNLRNCIHAMQQTGCVAIVNENDAVAVEEIKFGDNDLIAAQVTNLLRADLLILLTVVDGVLDGAGKTISVVREMEDATGHVTGGKSSRGSGGMGSKLMAAGTVKTAGEPVLIANGKSENIILRLLEGEETGTLVLPASRRLSSRSRWIGLTAKTVGTLVVDEGCAKALGQNKSLLASGIVGTTGEFERGDAVAIVDGKGDTIARGLTNYSREDVEKIKGKRSSEFGGLLGTESYYDEVIHRDDLVTGKPETRNQKPETRNPNNELRS